MLRQDLFERLRRTSLRLHDAIVNLDEADWTRRPIGEEWSAWDIVMHVIASDTILAPRVFQILARDEPPMPIVDDGRLMAVLGRASLTIDQRVDLFALRRAELIGVLSALEADEWQREGIHEGLGRQSIETIVGRLIEHEDEHMAQLDATVARV